MGGRFNTFLSSRFDGDHQVCQASPHRSGDVQESKETAGWREKEEAGWRSAEPAQRHGQHVRQRLIDPDTGQRPCPQKQMEQSLEK